MPEPDSRQRNPDDVKEMFARVAPSYDTINRVMSFGLDVIWRRKLVKTFTDADKPHKNFIDIACGSGDVCIELARLNPTAKIVGIDFCVEMIAEAKKKLSKSPFSSSINFMDADCEKIPFDDESFDGATISFGFRNFRNRQKCLEEIARVLAKGGRLSILEVARAKKKMAAAQKIFMEKFVPNIASTLGGTRKDYEYLAKTTIEFPSSQEIITMIENAGFTNVTAHQMGFGLVAITSGVKK